MTAKESLIEKFWNKINRSGKCWNWTGCINNGGYGSFNLNGKIVMAHRFSWEFYNNQKIPDRHVVMHICDNPKCVNPKHLMIGTRKDNMQDASQKLRCGHGERNGMAKLTESQVLKIKELYKSTQHTISAIASMFNVAYITIWQIVHNVRWCYLNATE